MLDKLVPQLRQPTCAATSAGRGGIPGCSRARSTALRAAPPREARERRQGTGRGGGGTVFKGARRAGGRVNEAMSESRAESLVRDVGKAVVWASRVSGARRAGGGVRWRTVAAC